MPNMQQVSFTDPYQMDAERIRRQQMLAMQLQAQSDTPTSPGEMVSGYYVPTSPLTHLAKALKGVNARSMVEQGDREMRELGERRDNDYRLDQSELIAQLRGQPAEMREDAAGNVDAIPAQAPNPKAIENMQFRSPMFRQIQAQQTLEQFKPKAPIRIGKDDTLVDPTTFRPVAEGRGGMHVVGGNLVPDRPSVPGGKIEPLYTAPEKDEAAKFKAILTAAGIDPASPTGQKLFMNLALKTATHQPPTQVTTNVSTEKRYGEQFAGVVAKSDVDMREAAIKAPQLAERANQVKQLLAGGKVITGTAADFRLAFAKAAQLVGIGNGSAADTEQVAVSLAQNTLDAIKASGLGAGSGFSNADRDFLEKAVGGKISLEASTINRLSDLAHRAATRTAEKWNTRVKEIPRTALEGTGIKSDPIPVPQLFEQSGGLSAAEAEELKNLRERLNRGR